MFVHMQESKKMNCWKMLIKRKALIHHKTISLTLKELQNTQGLSFCIIIFFINILRYKKKQ